MIHGNLSVNVCWPVLHIILFSRMACKTHDFYFIILLAAVLYSSACAEETTEDESVPVDRNSLSSIRLPSKYIIGSKFGMVHFDRFHLYTSWIICNSAKLTDFVIWITKVLLHSTNNDCVLRKICLSLYITTKKLQLKHEKRKEKLVVYMKPKTWYSIF